MMVPRLVACSLAMLLMGAGAQAASGADLVKHSGRILVLDPAHGQLVLEEVGPWQVRDGVTQVIRRTIALTPQTVIAIVLRANPPGGYPGEFIEGRLEPGDLDPGDFVTVECRSEGRRLVATRIVVADTTEAIGPQP
jgi:hypothetical protein